MPDGRHLANYLMFLVAVAFLYRLMLRVATRKVAWITTALFATQPLVFGHAFINQKDTPFMSLFLATVVLGMLGFDSWLKPPAVISRRAARLSGADQRGLLPRLTEAWGRANERDRLFALGAAVVFAAFAFQAFFVGILHDVASSLLGEAYDGVAPGLIQALFNRVATDAYKTPLPMYQGKLDSLFHLGDIAGCLVLLGLTLWAWARVLPLLGQVPASVWKRMWHPSYIASAILLGATICVRQVGLFAGVLVALYALGRLRRKAIPLLFVYGAVAASVTYATWPYLWGDPLGRALASLTHVAQFPGHPVLYLGERISSRSLPWTYVPIMLLTNLTEPAVAVILAGGLLTISRILKRRENLLLDQGIFALWIAIPLLMLFFTGMSTYGIRQFLFLLPPLFVVGGMMIQAIISRFPWWGVEAALLGVVLVPGILSDIALHPYEYIYFNSLAGGVRGADGRFGLDTWCTSLREGVDRVNAVAHSGATVFAGSDSSLITPFLRADLSLASGRVETTHADFVVRCMYHSGGATFDGYQLVYEVARNGVVLTSDWARVAKER